MYIHTQVGYVHLLQKMGQIAVTLEFDKYYMTLFEQIHMFVIWYSLSYSMKFVDAISKVAKHVHAIVHMGLILVGYGHAGRSQ
jgi:hypothetical protein